MLVGRVWLHHCTAMSASAGKASCKGRSLSIRIRFNSPVGFYGKIREQVGARNDCVKK